MVKQEGANSQYKRVKLFIASVPAAILVTPRKEARVNSVLGPTRISELTPDSIISVIDSPGVTGCEDGTPFRHHKFWR